MFQQELYFICYQNTVLMILNAKYDIVKKMSLLNTEPPYSRYATLCTIKISRLDAVQASFLFYMMYINVNDKITSFIIAYNLNH